MGALTADKQYQFSDPVRGFNPQQAAVKIYQGSLVGDNGSGYARNLNAGDPFMGFSDEQVDNSGGSAGDERCPLITKGKVLVEVSGAVIGDIGKPVYASDDQTYTYTQGSNSYIGRVVEFEESGKVWVEFDAAKGALGSVAELTDNTGGSPTGTLAAVTLPASLTDSTGGSAGDTLAALTNTDNLTDSTGGSADDTVDDVSTAVGQTQNAGSADKTDVDARLVSINDNFKEVVDQLATQRTANALLADWAASLVEELNAARAAISALRDGQASTAAKVNNILRMIE